MVDSYCGYVAIIGRPNVGKSTLLNCILNRKLVITSHKPQTTRHRILGIKTVENTQYIYVDTPGIHKNAKKELQRYMNRTAICTIKGVDVIVFVIEANRWTYEDDLVLKKMQNTEIPVILAINKVDKITDKTILLPKIEELSAKMKFSAIIPISAMKNTQISALEEKVATLLPKSPHFFPEDQFTDSSERFIVSEFIREKLMRLLGDELPYGLTVDIEKFEEKEKIIHIAALIIVEKSGHKKIVIGSKGGNLKKVGQLARQDIEKLLFKKVFLELWVKVKKGWSCDAKELQRLGYRRDV